MTDVETWTIEQAKLGSVTVRIEPLHQSFHNLSAKELERLNIWTQFCLEHENEVLPVIHGDRFEKRTREFVFVWVQAPDCRTAKVKVYNHGGLPGDATFVSGSRRQVYFPVAPYYGGTSSMMGVIAKGIKRNVGGRFG